MPKSRNPVGRFAKSIKAKGESWDKCFGGEKYKPDDIVPVVADKVQQFFGQ
jgi:hypothetical protein